ncbi:MAG: phospholipase D-like domain-containing protein [Polyangiaceae bacterium]
MTWFDVGSDAVRFLRDGVEAFPAMLEAIRKAEHEVLMEMYWISADVCGTKFRDALVERAAAGVSVRVVWDPLGSLGTSNGFWDPLRKAGGEVAEYHGLVAFAQDLKLGRLEHRDHRKLIVVDGIIGFVGGLNISCEWLPSHEGGGGWRDDAIEVRGITAGELRSLFFETWRRMTHQRPHDVLPFPAKRTRPVWVLANNWRRRRGIRREYLFRIRHAKTSVDIANSYFIPDPGVRKALFKAVARGARVRVLVPARGDVPIVQYAVEALFEQLLKQGVEVYSLGGPMLHSKTAVVDDFATVGSYNLDERSWRKNLEVNLAVEDRAFADHVRQSFDVDVSNAVRMDLTSWQKRGPLRKTLEAVSFAMRKLW